MIIGYWARRKEENKLTMDSSDNYVPEEPGVLSDLDVFAAGISQACTYIGRIGKEVREEID